MSCMSQICCTWPGISLLFCFPDILENLANTLKHFITQQILMKGARKKQYGKTLKKIRLWAHVNFDLLTVSNAKVIWMWRRIFSSLPRSQMSAFDRRFTPWRWIQQFARDVCNYASNYTLPLPRTVHQSSESISYRCKVNLYLCLIKDHAIKTYARMELY